MRLIIESKILNPGKKFVLNWVTHFRIDAVVSMGDPQSPKVILQPCLVRTCQASRIQPVYSRLSRGVTQ